MMLDSLKLMLGIDDKGITDDRKDALLNMLLSRAEDTIKAYTRRELVPDTIAGLTLDIAVILYNRLGTEGETARAEGGVSQSFCDTLPQSILAQLNPYRRVGVIHAID